MRTYPHCDSNVLHGPGTCRFCDTYAADLQDQRITQGINFTNENDPDKLPCPATMRRPASRIHTWGGNAPVAEGERLSNYMFGETPDYDGNPDLPCTLPPKGWACKSNHGHSGACPTVPTSWYNKLKVYLLLRQARQTHV
jgi:hypothetical protein